MDLSRQKLRYATIRAGLNAIAYSGIADLLAQTVLGSVIFTLHHVRPDEEAKFQPNKILSITPEFLADAIETALELGLIPVRLHEMPSLLANKDEKRRFVAFTLDDGYRNNLQYAAPVFHRFNVPYTVFPTIGFIERRRSIWWETCQSLLEPLDVLKFDFGRGMETISLKSCEAKFRAFKRFADFVNLTDEDEAVERIDQLAQHHDIDPLAIVSDLVLDGAELSHFAKDPLMDVGAHSVSHVNFRRISDARLKQEIDGSIQAIEHYCGYRPKSFAFPYGWRSAYGQREEQAILEAGFRVGVTTRPQVLRRSSADNPASFGRVSLNGDFQERRYVKSLISGLSFKNLKS